uniref:Cdc42 effector protein 3 n=1 Tax=Callorhinchus milii TaxID=7868 RepID=K4FYL6_CALMI|nr:Cdc42 effector protein 3 [Callorhinchus milii]
MPAKTPIYLKTSTPKRGKKLKLRDVLSGDMISPPLGDVRHSAHIGRDGEGDMFGDISFLQGKYDVLPSVKRCPTSQSMIQEEYVRKKSLQSGTPGFQTLLKNAVSLPLFTGVQETQEEEQAPPKPLRLHLEEGPGQRSLSVGCAAAHFNSSTEMSVIPSFAKTIVSSFSFSATTSNTSSECSVTGKLGGKRILSVDSETGLSDENLFPSGSFLSDSGSVLGLDLDLGPSILDDVLRIMDEYKVQES